MVQTIHNTSLVPYLIAQKVISDYMVKTKMGMHGATFERYVTFLEHKSERLFDTDEHFRNQILKANDQRQQLAVFMEHWLHSEINKPIIPFVQAQLFQTEPIQKSLF